MENTAFVWNGHYIYWSSIILALAVVCSFAMLLALRLLQGKRLLSVFLLSPAAVVLGLYLGRLVHWYCRTQQYESFEKAMTRLPGGFSLVGVMAGCFLAAVIIKLLCPGDSLAQLLDSMAPAGMLGIALGRLSALFTNAMRGKFIITEPSAQTLPFGAQTVNSATGGVEWRSAVFSYQSALSFIAFLILAVFFVRNYAFSKKSGRNGDVFSAFLALWGAMEIVMDSMRYDALYLRSNGFVSMVQIAGACALVGVMVVYSLRSLGARGLRPLHFAAWGLSLALLGLAGYMEYYVQRHGDLYKMCYGIMGGSILAVLAIMAGLYLSSRKKYKGEH